MEVKAIIEEIDRFNSSFLLFDTLNLRVFVEAKLLIHSNQVIHK
jgi:hypothetical protein